MAFESLYNHFFQGADLAELRRMTQQYPWFGPAHFFELQKTELSDESYSTLAAKAALHFADPLLLHFQLSKKESGELKSLDMAFAARETPADVNVYEPAAAQPIDNPNFEVPETELTAPDPEPENDGFVSTPEEPAEVVNSEEKSLTENSAKQTEKMEEEALLFEPLHTTDYFASQGIKLSEVVQSGDKMGQQLRSFTQWLKTMKKIHPEGISDKNMPPAHIDSAVQHLAERSNQEEEVLTESMAVVYIQQGKLQKAREVYKKLSLLNPSKSAYFAAKLNEIQ
jgi:hypothetical protein